MRRRDLAPLLGLLVSLRPLVGAAQAEQARRISVVVDKAPETAAQIAAFEDALLSLGWAKEKNIHIAYYVIDLDQGSTALAVKASLASNPEIILTKGVLTGFVRKWEQNIPVVFVNVSDPLSQGFAVSLSHPRGHTTGFVDFESSVVGKWLQLLKEIAPSVTRIALLLNPDTSPAHGQLYPPLLVTASKSLGVSAQSVEVHDMDEAERALAEIATRPGGGLVVAADPFMIVHSADVARLARRFRLPAIYPNRFAALKGGLMSYGVDTTDLFRRAASYVDRILKGAKPSDLPIQLPTKFELVINQNAATALGLTVPPLLLMRADELAE
jgi:ABC-type uncharacterized transport system substrate-binding protein